MLGSPTEDRWPGWTKLPGAKSVGWRQGTGNQLRATFPTNGFRWVTSVTGTKGVLADFFCLVVAVSVVLALANVVAAANVVSFVVVVVVFVVNVVGVVLVLVVVVVVP